ncbi:MAG: ABC transporter ATP-binding protein [Rhodothermales bacterium]
MSLLSIDHVTKRYGDFVAVDQVSFEAQPGRILGLLGPNGAGKTSTIRMIAYITIPDEGQILFDGHPVGPESQQQMGYLPEERGLYKKLKVGEQLRYLAELKGLSRAVASDKIRYWLDRFDASDWAGKKVEELSKGMQQKIQFIATILPEPRLVILDEPFSGLDPINSELLRDIILELKEQGRTILFASHRMEQVEQLCDDICLISEGQILVKGPLRDVKRSFGRDTIVLEFEGDDAFLDDLEVQGMIRISNQSHHRAELRLLNGTPGRRVLDIALQHLDDIYRFELMEPPLSEIFVSVVNEQREKKEAASNYA